jgi:hypothetical protein
MVEIRHIKQKCDLFVYLFMYLFNDAISSSDYSSDYMALNDRIINK